MKPATRATLLEVNRRFYRDHAEAFAGKRERPWRGWDALLPRLEDLGRDTDAPRLLDLGCGHGRFAAFLRTAPALAAWTLHGVDASAGLLARARARELGDCRWDQIDFAGPDALPRGPYASVVAFGVLHGMPGERERQRLLEACAERLLPGGLLVFTTWRALADPRLVSRIRRWSAWDTARFGPLDVDDLEAGDHLLPWDQAPDAVRYFHAFEEAELERLSAGLAERGVLLVERYQADGKRGAGNDYFVFRGS
ncbi:MAG: class I SAM-dependent methyltransferase [Myxococcota bacterium]